MSIYSFLINAGEDVTGHAGWGWWDLGYSNTRMAMVPYLSVNGFVWFFFSRHYSLFTDILKWVCIFNSSNKTIGTKTYVHLFIGLATWICASLQRVPVVGKQWYLKQKYWILNMSSPLPSPHDFRSQKAVLITWAAEQSKWGFCQFQGPHNNQQTAI